MKIGKLSNEQLDRLILSKLKHIRNEVVMSPGIGIDCAAIDADNRICVLSTDPITAVSKGIGRLSVNVCCNDAAASGAEPIGLLVTLLLPPSVTEQEISDLTDELTKAAERANVEIIGGHTEITDAVTRIVTSTTVVAKADKSAVFSSCDVKKGDYIIMTKHAGIEGCGILADCNESLDTVLSKDEISLAKSFLEETSIVKEARFAAQNGASAMHDVTEGGVLGAVWEMHRASRIGIRLELSSIPVHPITVKICRHFRINPLRLMSSGALLISCSNATKMLQGLHSIGIDAAVIGRAVGEDIIFSDNTPIEPPESDELYKALN